MEIRKIQRTGGSTYIVSLPKQWADHVGLTSGMNVGITTRADGSLLISTDISSPSPTKKQLDVTDKTGYVLVREIIAFYIAGFNVIELVSKRITAEQKQTIRQITHKLIGPEIVEETADRMIVQDMLNPGELSLRQSVQRMYMIASSMLTDAMHALVSSDTDLAMDVSNRDDEVDKLYLLIEKQLRIMLRSGQVIDSQKDMTPDMGLDLTLAARPIKRIADHARKIALITISLEKQLPGDVVRMFKGAGQSASELVENSVDSLFLYDIDKAHNSVQMKMEMNKALRVIDKKLVTLDLKDALYLRIVSDSIDRIGESGANIAEIAINSTISKSV